MYTQKDISSFVQKRYRNHKIVNTEKRQAFICNSRGAQCLFPRQFLVRQFPDFSEILLTFSHWHQWDRLEQYHITKWIVDNSNVNTHPLPKHCLGMVCFLLTTGHSETLIRTNTATNCVTINLLVSAAGYKDVGTCDRGKCSLSNWSLFSEQ